MSEPFNAETAGNAEEIEMQFAVKTVEHLEAYEKLITSLPPRKLRLTPSVHQVDLASLSDRL